MRVDGGLAGRATNTFSTTLAGRSLAAVVAQFLGSLALDGLAETSVDVCGARADKRVGGGGLVVGGLCGGLLGVAGVCGVGGGAAGGEGLGVEFGDGVVAYEDTGFVLGILLEFLVGWIWRVVVTYAIVVLTGSASRLGVELARAASGHLVGDSLDVVVGGVGGGHFDVWCLS